MKSFTKHLQARSQTSSKPACITQAFTLVELLLITVVLFIVGVILLNSLPRPRPQHSRTKCINNLKNLGLAARIYATDNNDLMPGAYFLSNKLDLATINAADYFRMLSNELSTPKIIQCPADKNRQVADSFTNLTTKNISYFISLTAQETSPQAFLAGDRNLQYTNGTAIPPGLFTLTTNTQLSFSKDMHSLQGNIAIADGSVQQFSNNRLKLSTSDQDLSTNILLIP
jgi:type II secretory pathway pseudopilin PulG